MFDDGNEQHCIAVEVMVWGDTYDEARAHLDAEMARLLPFDYAIEEAP